MRNNLRALTHRRGEFLLLAFAAATVPLLVWALWALVLHQGPNDYCDYWLAGRLVMQGHSPYDLAALSHLAQAEGLHFSLGGGYSYPPPFALLMVPLAAMPFYGSFVVFTVLSLASFALTVAIWLGWAHGWEPSGRRRRLALALAAGLYPPTYGSVVIGQANLTLFPFLALGAAWALNGGRWRAWWGGCLLGLAAIVKLVPGVLVVPLGLGRRFRGAIGVIAGALGALGLTVLVAPWTSAGSGGLSSLLKADTYYTNQSLNGFVTRLVWDAGRSQAIWYRGFDPAPAMLAVTALFGLATLAIIWRARSALTSRRGMALALGLALVAGIVGAPKESTWNQAIALVAVGLLLAVETPDLRLSRLGRFDRGLLAAWFGLTMLWTAIWALNLRADAAGWLAPVVTLAWSSALYGMLALWWLLARRLLRHDLEPQASA